MIFAWKRRMMHEPREASRRLLWRSLSTNKMTNYKAWTVIDPERIGIKICDLPFKRVKEKINTRIWAIVCTKSQADELKKKSRLSPEIKKQLKVVEVILTIKNS